MSWEYRESRSAHRRVRASTAGDGSMSSRWICSIESCFGRPVPGANASGAPRMLNGNRLGVMSQTHRAGK